MYLVPMSIDTISQGVEIFNMNLVWQQNNPKRRRCIMKKCISMVLAAIMLLYLIPTTVFASTIMMVDVENIDLPVAGAKPDFGILPTVYG